jgi:hypothetical protein
LGAGLIVGIIPTYREGPLAAAAVRSLLQCCQSVHVAEGPIGEPTGDGYPTDLKEFAKNPRVAIRHGAWATEIEKRNDMLARTRRYKPPVWGVFLDADEIMVGAEWVPDLIWAGEVNNEAEGRDVATVPLLRVEVDGSVGEITRLVRVDLVERHVLSMSQWKFFSSDVTATFPVSAVWRPGEPMTEIARPPLPGEPHIYHRAYYRPPKRGEHRLYKTEMDDWDALAADELARLGIRSKDGLMPVQQDPGFIVASEQEAQAPPPPTLLDELLRGKQ